jgi:hypothetical protein
MISLSNHFPLFFISPKTAKCYAFFEKILFFSKVPCRCGAGIFLFAINSLFATSPFAGRIGCLVHHLKERMRVLTFTA